MSGLPLWLHSKAGEARIYVRTPFELKDVVKELPGSRWDPEATWPGWELGQRPGAWHVPATPSSAAALVHALTGRELAIEPGVRDLLEAAARERGALVHKTAEDLPEIPGKLPAWLHQKRAFHWARDRRASLLAMDMGTGKSRVAVSLLDEWGSELAVLLCPRSVMGVWPNQFRTHSERNWLVAVPPQNATVLKRTAYLVKQVELARVSRRPVCVVCNYEAAPMESMAALLLELAQQGADVVLDECHRIKAPGGKQSVFCGKLTGKARHVIGTTFNERTVEPHVLGLTGTPMPHSPLDLYGQFRALDPGVFGTSFNRFRNRYAVMGGFEGRQVIGYQREDELARLLGENSFVVRKDEAGLGLPPVVHNERTFELAGKSLKAYKTLENDFILGIGEGSVTAANALTKLLRLQQVTSGYVRDDDGVDHEVGDEKLRVLRDILEDLPAGEPVVVFARFKHDLARIKALALELGKRYGEVSGQTKPPSEVAVRMWGYNEAAAQVGYGLNEHSQMRDDVDLICLQLQAGGVGIDLTRACYCIYYSLDFSLGNYDQTLARVDRPGQTRPVSYFHLIATGTKDEVVYKALSERREVVDAVIDSSRETGGEAAAA